jgi:hypothetical protein
VADTLARCDTLLSAPSARLNTMRARSGTRQRGLRAQRQRLPAAPFGLAPKPVAPSVFAH